MIAPESLHRLLRFDEATGRLYWRERTPDMFTATAAKPAEQHCSWWNGRYAGKEALTSVCDGYRWGLIWRKAAKAHRVVYAMTHGEWAAEVDHINGDRLDNRPENLRAVSRKENCQNRALGKQNKSGVVGVFWAKRQRRWAAHIGVGNGTTRHLGYYRELSDAVSARRAAERELGFHPNHGRQA